MPPSAMLAPSSVSLTHTLMVSMPIFWARPARIDLSSLPAFTLMSLAGSQMAPLTHMSFSCEQNSLWMEVDTSPLQ